MKKSVFVTFCLILVAAYLEFYSFMRYQFSGVEVVRHQKALLEKQLEQEELRRQLLSFELNEFKQNVAAILPESAKGKETETGYPLRNLASVVSEEPMSNLNIERASSLFEKGRALFREKKYQESNEVFKRITDSYPESIHIVEAHFFLAEGAFQLKEYDQAVLTIESMITLFPESELTGYALLRLGRIYELQDRLEDAAQVYRTIVNSYRVEALHKQAQSALKAVEL